jgi:hypothetical protein
LSTDMDPAEEWGGNNGDSPGAVADPLPPVSFRLASALIFADGFLVHFTTPFVFILDSELRGGPLGGAGG